MLAPPHLPSNDDGLPPLCGSGGGLAACMCRHMNAYACIFVHMHAYACLCIHMHAYACTCTHMHAYACICMRMHAYALRMHAHACICMHMHPHARSQLPMGGGYSIRAGGCKDFTIHLWMICMVLFLLEIIVLFPDFSSQNPNLLLR